MGGFQMPNWGEVFTPDASLFESFLRGSVVYLSLLILFRIVLKRQGGSIGLPDIMLVVLVSECVSNSLSANANSVPNGLAVVLALLFWNYTLDKLCYHWPWVQRRLEPQPIQVVKNGKPIAENLASEGITDDELQAQLRENGIDDVTKVKAAWVEADGNVSVIPKEGDDTPPSPAPRAPSDAPRPDRVTPPDEKEAIDLFLSAAAKMRVVLAWHERQATDHDDAAKAVRELLAKHGLQPPH